jgi:hypothetical protein
LILPDIISFDIQISLHLELECDIILTTIVLISFISSDI